MIVMSEQNTQREAAVQQQQAVEQSRNLNAELQVLAKFGGFNVLESSVDGIQNLNPERKARRNIFLSDPERTGERKELKKRLEMWLDMLEGNKSIGEMVELCQKKSAAVSGLLSQNQLKAVEEVKQLEKSYRTVMLFYKNTDSDKIKNISIVNASMDQLTDLDNSFFIDAIANELRANYDRLDLRTNYSLLVIPGYLGSNKVIEKWAKIAHDNKVMIYTDFADLEKPDDVIEMFFDSNLSGGDVYKSNVCLQIGLVVLRSIHLLIFIEAGHGALIDAGEYLRDRHLRSGSHPIHQCRDIYCERRKVVAVDLTVGQPLHPYNAGTAGERFRYPLHHAEGL